MSFDKSQRFTEITSIRDDPVTLAVLASIPQQETVFNFLTGCWKRLNTIQLVFNKAVRKAIPTAHHILTRHQSRNREDTAHASALFDRIRELIVSYIGLDMQDPSMFSSKSE